MSAYGWLRSLLTSRKTPGSWYLRTGTLAAGAGLALAVAGIAILFADAFWNSPPAPHRLAAVPTADDRTGALAGMTAAGKLDPQRVEAAFAPHRHRLEGLRVLMVPSFLSDFLMPARDAGLTDYFSRQEDWLEVQDVSVDIAASNTAAPAAENAAWIANYIDATPEPVCLITHSKGGVDALTFLLAATPAQRAKIACWIALQPPFGGSPVADQVLADPPATLVSNGGLAVMGGSIEAVRDLGTARRQHILATREDDIRNLSRCMPILSVAGQFTADSWLQDGFPYTIPAGWIADRGYANDGLVPVPSAKLPGTPYVLIDAADHGTTIRDQGPLTDDAGLFLKALFAVMYDAHTYEADCAR